MAAFILKRKAHVKTSIFKCIRTGLLAGSKILGAISERDIANKNIQPGDWNALRDMFPLSRDYIQLSTFLLASHPKPVSDAIEKHRRAFNENPSDYWYQHFQTIDTEICQSAAEYMGGRLKI